MLGLQMCQNLELRQTLVQKLGLESEYLETFLVRSEKLLKGRRGQRGLALVRHLADEDEYRSVMDFLVGLFVPSMKPAIKAYYEGHGQKLGEEFTWSFIDNLDRKMVMALEHLARLSEVIWEAQLTNKTLKTEVAAAEVDLMLRPLFPVVVPQASMAAVA